MKIGEKHTIIFDGSKIDTEYEKKISHLIKSSKIIGFLDFKGNYYGPIKLQEPISKTNS